MKFLFSYCSKIVYVLLYFKKSTCFNHICIFENKTCFYETCQMNLMNVKILMITFRTWPFSTGSLIAAAFFFFFFSVHFPVCMHSSSTKYWPFLSTVKCSKLIHLLLLIKNYIASQ